MKAGSRRGDFCPGCGMTITKEPWPHLDKDLRPGQGNAPKAPSKPLKEQANVE